MSKFDPTTVRSDSARYFIGSAFTACCALASAMTFTRVLGASEYGRWSLVLATVTLCNSVCFLWLRSGVRRYFAVYEAGTERFVSTVAGLFVLSALVCWLLLHVGPGGFGAQTTGIATALILGVVASQSSFEIAGETLLAQLRPLAYNRLQIWRATFALAGGTAAAILGFGVAGIALTLAVSYMTCSCVVWLSHRRFMVTKPSTAQARTLFLYASPLVLGYLALYGGESVSRFVLAGRDGTGVVGRYGANADIGTQVVTLLMMVVNLSVVPRAIRLFELREDAELRALQSEQFYLLLLAVIPVGVTLAWCAPGASRLLFGADFESVGASAVPLALLGSFLLNIRSLYFDTAFVLARRLHLQVLAASLGAAAQIATVVLLVPRFGWLAASYAAIVGGMVALAFSVVLGRRVLALPLPGGRLLKVLMIASGALALVAPFGRPRGVLSAVVVGATMVCVQAVALGAPTLIRRRHLAAS